mmetsp:Transcript_6305/g.17823  ORF Transcript_6305/g.17823 Transcript_6305/m.17823 type:complete len:206 (-) Transcript_6305:1166-1783(-)
MGFFLGTIVRLIAILAGLAFGLLCLVAGLFYLAEFVEEHTTLTKKIMRYVYFAVIATHVVLLFLDDLPLLYLLFSLGCHVVYFQLLKTYPFVNITGHTFLGCVVLSLVNHFLWFYYFANNYYDYRDVLSFFTVCVWMVPFSFFITISAGDNVLPFQFPVDPQQDSGIGGDGDEKKKKTSNVLLALFRYLAQKRDELFPTDDTKIL